MVSCIGLLMAVGTQQTQSIPTDTFGHGGQNANSNASVGLVSNITAQQDRGLGLGALFIGVFLLVAIILGAMALMRKKGNWGGGKYRT